MTDQRDTAEPVPSPPAPQPAGHASPPPRFERHPVAMTVLVVVAAAMMSPFVLLAIKSVTPLPEMSSDSWLPSHAQWSNFADAVSQIPFWRYARGSVVLSTTFALLTTFSSALVGYGFARLHGPGKKALFVVMVSMMIIPQIVTLIPTFLLFQRVGMVGTYWPWVLWGLQGAPYVIFLYRQYYAGFPKELDEAARLDGASQLQIFTRIYLPLSLPLLVTAFVIAFNATWGDFVAPNLLLDDGNTTLAVGVARGYVNQHQVPLPNLVAAGSLMYVLPVVALFLAIQRFYVRGFVSSGLK